MVKNVRIRLYVGQNNSTKRLETAKLRKCLKDCGIVGYTLYKSLGIWDGIPEKSNVVEVIGAGLRKTVLNRTITTIKRQLRQDAIFVTNEVINAELY
jgi:hypothetical protein